MMRGVYGAKPWLVMYLILLPTLAVGIAAWETFWAEPTEPFLNALEYAATQILLGPSLLAALVVAVYPVVQRAVRNAGLSTPISGLVAGTVLGLAAGLVWYFVVPFGPMGVVLPSLLGGVFGVTCERLREATGKGGERVPTEPQP